jgi:hypothetical protein
MEVRWRDLRGIRWIREPLQWIVTEKVSSHPWFLGGYIVNTHFLFSSPCIHPPGKNFSTKGTEFLEMDHDTFKEALWGNIVIAWNPWGFSKKQSSYIFWTQLSYFRLQVCFHLVLSIFDLEHARNTISFHPLWQEAANYHVRLWGV